MKTQLYFPDFDMEFCTTLDNIIYRMLADHDRMDCFVYRAVRQTKSEYFWCKEFSSAGLKSDKTCGKWCESYVPKNGIKGVCKHYRNTYEPEEKYHLTVKPKLTKV
jgi:hypothetical protein